MKRLKCPGCGELMGEGSPYVTITPLMHDIGEISGHGPVPEAIQNLPASGHNYECDHCHARVDIPVFTPISAP